MAKIEYLLIFDCPGIGFLQEKKSEERKSLKDII